MDVRTPPTGGDADAALLARAAAGDSRAVGLLYDRYSGVTFGLALAILSDEPAAQEVVAETFRDVVTGGAVQSAVDGGHALEPRLTRVVRSKALARCRASRSKRTAADGGSVARVAAGYSDHGALRSRQDSVLKVLDALPAVQRRVLELAYFRGLAIREIAEEIVEPEQRVATALRLAMDALKRAVAVPPLHHTPR